MYDFFIYKYFEFYSYTIYIVPTTHYSFCTNYATNNNNQFYNSTYINVFLLIYNIYLFNIVLKNIGSSFKIYDCTTNIEYNTTNVHKN